MSLQDIYDSYTAWQGAPAHILKFEDDPQPALPIHSLLYLPIEKEEVFESSLYTAGMSAHVMSEECPHAELNLDVLGRHPMDDYERLGQGLINIIRARFQQGLDFIPNSVIRNISLPLFEKMNSLLITDWAKGVQEYLPDLEPPVRLLRVLPLFDSEAAKVEAIGDLNTITAFVKSGINWADPSREPLTFSD
jgi:Suppressor of fused protein (SUFU)